MSAFAAEAGDRPELNQQAPAAAQNITWTNLNRNKNGTQGAICGNRRESCGSEHAVWGAAPFILSETAAVSTRKEPGAKKVSNLVPRRDARSMNKARPPRSVFYRALARRGILLGQVRVRRSQVVTHLVRVRLKVAINHPREASGFRRHLRLISQFTYRNNPRK